MLTMGYAEHSDDTWPGRGHMKPDASIALHCNHQSYYYGVDIDAITVWGVSHSYSRFKRACPFPSQS